MSWLSRVITQAWRRRRQRQAKERRAAEPQQQENVGTMPTVPAGALANDGAPVPPTTESPPLDTTTSRLDVTDIVDGYAWAYQLARMKGDAAVGDGVVDDRGFVGSGSAWALFALTDPPGELTGTQKFRVRAKASSTTGAPALRVKLYEGGSLVSDLGAATLTTTMATYEFAWNANALADPSGTAVQIRVEHEAGTPGAGYTSIDAIDWVATHYQSGGGAGGGGGSGGGGAVIDWPAGWGARPPLGSLHGVGQAFNFTYNSQGELVWQPLRDHDAWLGRPSNIVFVGPNMSPSGIPDWDGVAGGAGNSDSTWGGQLKEVNPTRAFDPNYWPVANPIVLALTAVPLSHSNRGVDRPWGRPGIWNEIQRGDYDVYYQRLFRRLATRCGVTGRDPRTVVLRWCWEANGNWYPHSIGPDKANFILAWRRTIDIMRNSVSAVLGAGKSFMVEFGPTTSLTFGDGSSERLWNIYPGDDWVDICGLGIHDYVGIKVQADWDIYLRHPTTIAGVPRDGILDWYDFAISHGKWVGTSEIESNYIPRTYFPKTENMNVMWTTGFEPVRRRYDGRFVYFIYLWNSRSALKRPDGWGEPYRQLYK